MKFKKNNLPDMKKEARAFEYSHHVYDINLTDLFFTFKTLYCNDLMFLEMFESFFKGALKFTNCSFKDIIENKIPFIAMPPIYNYITSLAYQLMIIDKYRIPLFLNYHYAKYPSQNNKEFVNIIEYRVYDLITNYSPKELNTAKIKKILSGWIENKQNSLENYFQHDKDDDYQEGILTFILQFFASTTVKNKDYNYLIADNSAIENLVEKFISFDSDSIEKMYNKNKIKCKWNDSIFALTYFIKHLNEIKGNGYYLLDDIFISNFIEFSFLDKDNKRIGEDTIKKYLYKIKKNYLSKTVLEIDMVLDKAL